MAQSIKPKADPLFRLRTHESVYLPGANRFSESLQHPVVQAVLHILKELLASGGTRLVPITDTTEIPDDERVLYERLLAVQGYTSAIRHLAIAHVSGLSVLEIVWGEDYFPHALRPVPTEQVQVGIDTYGEITEFRVSTRAGLQSLPLGNALYVIGSPMWYLYGVQELPLESMRKYLQLYDRLLRSLDLYLQRHGVPTVFVRVPPNYTQSEVEQLYTAFSKMQDALVAVIPSDEVNAEFLEPKGTGMELSLRLMELIERLVARSLLGSILAVYEAQYGTRAQAQVHWEVTQRLISSLQQPVEDAIQAQLWSPICMYQLGRAPYSRVELNELDYVSRADVLRNLADLVGLGMVDPERDKDWLRGMIGLGNNI